MAIWLADANLSIEATCWAQVGGMRCGADGILRRAPKLVEPSICKRDDWRDGHRLMPVERSAGESALAYTGNVQ